MRRILSMTFPPNFTTLEGSWLRYSLYCCRKEWKESCFQMFTNALRFKAVVGLLRQLGTTLFTKALELYSSLLNSMSFKNSLKDLLSSKIECLFHNVYEFHAPASKTRSKIFVEYVRCRSPRLGGRGGIENPCKPKIIGLGLCCRG